MTAMKLLFAAVLGGVSLIGCRSQETTLVSFKWSHERPDDSDYANFGDVVTASDASGRVVAKVWTTTYGHQDLKRAQAWLSQRSTEVVLCFSAPNLPLPPSTPTNATAAVAYPTLLTYELSGVSDQVSLIGFGEDCRGER